MVSLELPVSPAIRVNAVFEADFAKHIYKAMRVCVQDGVDCQCIRNRARYGQDRIASDPIVISMILVDIPGYHCDHVFEIWMAGARDDCPLHVFTAWNVGQFVMLTPRRALWVRRAVPLG